MASDLDLHCLPMSHKKDARLTLVKYCQVKTHVQTILEFDDLNMGFCTFEVFMHENACDKYHEPVGCPT